MEKIEIKDFAGIKDITIEVKKINILIGPQATGKSIITKLLYFFKSFVFELPNIAKDLKTQEYLEQEYIEKFKDYFSVSSSTNNNFFIQYCIDDEFIEISQNTSKNITLSYSDFYTRQYSNLINATQQHNQKILEISKNKPEKILSKLEYYLESSYDIQEEFLFYLSQHFNKISAFYQTYIPAGRSFWVNIKKGIFTFLSKKNAIDQFLIDFGNFYESAKNPTVLNILNNLNSDDKTLYSEIKKISENILCGFYFQKDGEDYLQLKEGRQVNIFNSSSGQQETLPLIIILKTIALIPHNIGRSIYIEEPEAHIFPSTQRDIVELISTVYNARKDSLQFFITTHSPYILTAFNNLLQAGILSIDATEEKIEQISRHVPKSRFLKPGEVAVYSLENGYCKSIIDEETGLIDTNIIDEVSNELAIQFDELLELEE